MMLQVSLCKFCKLILYDCCATRLPVICGKVKSVMTCCAVACRLHETSCCMRVRVNPARAYGEPDWKKIKNTIARRHITHVGVFSYMHWRVWPWQWPTALKLELYLDILKTYMLTIRKYSGEVFKNYNQNRTHRQIRCDWKHLPACPTCIRVW